MTDELQRAGLTGRGGAGFPTGLKVATVAAAGRGRLGRGRPIVAVNVMEGEPASAKDRALATGTPHLVLDGAMALGLAVDATEVRVCVAQEHFEAASSLEEAADRRLGARLDPLPLAVDRVPGGYVAGEESALARWLDRGDGKPVYRPDRPAVPRADGRPVLVENAETTAHVALIARHGADWFRTVGLPDAPGTTLLTLSGAVPRPGVWEVPLGTSLRSVLRDAGAGPGTGVELGGVLLGGYSGTWLPPEALATPLAPPDLAAAGATLGARVVVALPITVTSDAGHARERIDRAFALYPRLPSYRAMLDREGAEQPSDIALVGTEEEVAGGAAAIADAGATDLVASIVGNPEERERTRAVLATLARR